MRTVDYDNKETYTGSTETHIAVDEQMDHAAGNLQQAYEEGFASASGVRGETAETGGRIKYPDMKDDARPDRTPDSIEKENAGLADS